MVNKTVLIVGCGNIGSKLYEEYKALNPDRYDPYKAINEKRDIKYDFAFIAVDTPMDENGVCDLSQVRCAIKETNAEIIVLRSTVPPKTTEMLKEQYKKRIVFCPEFYGTTQHCDEKTFNYNFAILGGDKDDCDEVMQLLQEIYDARFRFGITDSTTAELTKYMANTMLASKVSLCVQFFEIAKQCGVNYNEMRELWLMDERFNRAHTFVYKEHPYWTSHCFDKDLRALVNFSKAPLIEAVLSYNEQCKEKLNDERKQETDS